MSLTDSQRCAALEMRKRDRMSTFDISMALGVARQDLTRLFVNESLRAQDLANTSKIRANDCGLADAAQDSLRDIENMRAAELWLDRMKDARWNVRRREDQG